MMLSAIEYRLLKLENDFIVPVENECFLMPINCSIGLFTVAGRCLRVYPGQTNSIIYCTVDRTRQDHPIVVAGDQRGILHFWNFHTGACEGEPLILSPELLSLKIPLPIYYITYVASNGCLRILFIHNRGQLHHWDLASKQKIEINDFRLDEEVSCATVYQTQEHHNVVVIGLTSKSKLYCLNIETKSLTFLTPSPQIIGRGYEITCLTTCTSSTGRTMIIAGDNANRLMRWYADTGELLKPQYLKHEDAITCCTTYQDSAYGAVIVAGDDRGRLVRWQAESGALLDIPFCRRLQRYSIDRSPWFVDVDLRGHLSPVEMCISYQAVDRTIKILSGSEVSTLQWNAEQFTTTLPIEAFRAAQYFAGSIYSSLYRTDKGQVLALIMDHEGYLHRYDIDTEADIGILANQPAKQKALFCIHYTRPTEQVIIVAIHEDNNLRCWDGVSGALIGEPIFVNRTITKRLTCAKFCMAYEEGGIIFLAGVGEKHWFRCNTSTSVWQTHIFTSNPYPRYFFMMTYQHQGETIAVSGIILDCNREQFVRCNIRTGEVITSAIISGSNRRTNCCTIYQSAMGDEIGILIDIDGNLRRWNLATGESIFPTLEHIALKTVVSCTTYRVPDGRTIIVVSCEKGQLLQWEAESGRLLQINNLPYPVIHFDYLGDYGYLRLSAPHQIKAQGYFIMRLLS